MVDLIRRVKYMWESRKWDNGRWVRNPKRLVDVELARVVNSNFEEWVSMVQSSPLFAQEKEIGRLLDVELARVLNLNCEQWASYV